MKALLVLSLALFASSTQAAILTNKAYIVLDQQADVQYGMDVLAVYACAGEAYAVDYRSFEAAKAVKALPSGFWGCEGDFIMNRATNNGQMFASEGLQIFRLGKCEKVTKEEMEKACQQ